MGYSKKGLAYYNVDTDRYQDIKIKRLKKTFGCMGIAVYDYILCEIYRVRGCFIEWGESTAFDVAEYFNLKETQVNEIVNYCCSVGLFKKELLTSERVLTSSSIQKRYSDMCVRAKRKDIDIPKNIKITEELPKITEDCPKEKNSKVKKRKECTGNPKDPRSSCPEVSQGDLRDSSKSVAVLIPIRKEQKDDTLTEFPIYEEQVSEWQELYPAVDVLQEVRAMRGWSLSNPTRQKTKRGVLRFVNSWLAKAQNKGGLGLARGQPSRYTTESTGANLVQTNNNPYCLSADEVDFSD
jgi:hypothetical protein